MLLAQKNFRTALISLFVSFIVLTLKTKAYYATHSISVLSDAVETVINVITALIALYAVKVAAEPADENHPYGHGKMEYFSAAFEGGLIFFASLAILFQSFESFFIPNEITNINTGVQYLAWATALNFLTGLHLVFAGRAQKSEALKASGKHILSDVVTTLGIFVGLFLVKITGLNWIDSVVGIIIGFWLGFESYKIIRENSGALMDETDDHSLGRLTEVIKKHRTVGIIDIHHLKMIRSGNFHHIDAHMVVPEFWDIQQAHALAREFEINVVKEYDFDGEFAFHMDPCQKKYCSACALENCQIRSAKFAKIRAFTQEHVTKGPQYTD
jgi:cation diffusion facilitator family transporter